jgi:hypothetical protein
MQARPEIVAQVRAQYGPTLTDEQCGLLTNEVAWILAQADPAWGVSAKPQGKAARLPNGTLIAHDILHYRTTNTLIDILQAAGAESRPQWAEVPYHGDPTGRPWMPATNPATWAGGAPAPAPGPTPSPTPAGPSLAVLEALVQTLAQRVDLLAHNSTETAEGVQRLEAALKAGIPLSLRARMLGEVRGTVGGPSR